MEEKEAIDFGAYLWLKTVGLFMLISVIVVLIVLMFQNNPFQ